MRKISKPSGVYKRIYAEANKFFSQFDRGRTFYGFKILNGPPRKRARILFIGYQPAGGRKEWRHESDLGTHRGWPRECEYASADWTLAKKIRSLLESEIDLSQCVGLNAIFLRHTSQKSYMRDYKAKHSEIVDACLPLVKEIIEDINPRKIITIGISTLRLFNPQPVPVLWSLTKGRNGRKRVLACSAKIAGRSAIGVLHLSGARISQADRKRIRKEILA